MQRGDKIRYLGIGDSTVEVIVAHVTETAVYVVDFASEMDDEEAWHRVPLSRVLS